MKSSLFQLTAASICFVSLHRIKLAFAYSPFLVQHQALHSCLDRRAMLITGATTIPLIGASSQSLAASSPVKEKLEPFTDARHGFTVSVPTGWSFTEQQLPDRRTLLLWRDPVDEATLVFIAYTPVRDDVTSLGSFGSVDQVATQTILPKQGLMGMPEDPALKMFSASARKQAYIFDYRYSVPGPDRTSAIPTHFQTIFALHQVPNAAGSVLVTITAQTPENRYTNGLDMVFDSMINSYAKSA